MNKNLRQSLISIVLVVFGFVATFVLSNFLENNRSVLPENFEDEDLTLQGANLKGYVFGFEGLLADWYWMKSLQYIGNKLLNSKEDLNLDNLNPINPRLLYPYLDNATTLDPKFLAAYQYGAIVLPAVDNEQAIKLTQKGIENNPNEWRFYHNLGFIYWRLENYEKAAVAYEQGSRIEGAPDFMKLMAAKMRSDGGSRAVARDIYMQMLDSVQDVQIKDNISLRLLELDSLDEREKIQKSLDDFKLKNSHCVNNWGAISPFLLKEKLPNDREFLVDAAGNLIDPSGTPYILDKENCAVKLDKEKTKIPLK